VDRQQLGVARRLPRRPLAAVGQTGTGQSSRDLLQPNGRFGVIPGLMVEKAAIGVEERHGIPFRLDHRRREFRFARFAKTPQKTAPSLTFAKLPE
jgi:hypothetical protein